MFLCLCFKICYFPQIYRYLNLKIQEGDAHHITCPGYNCSRLVPVDVIESVVSRAMARRYLQFDIKVNHTLFDKFHIMLISKVLQDVFNLTHYLCCC